jgi:hypothetical protein
MDERETWEFTRRERAYLIDGLMMLMHQMEAVPENDLSELPDLQRLLGRLIG